MRILDRYVLFSFLRNYLISFMVLIGMYIVLHMVFNFDELVEPAGQDMQRTTFDVVLSIADFYFYQSFLIFAHMSGIIPVVAAAFTLIRLSRFNELSAILAAGVPLLRVATPIILASVVLQALLAIDQELIIPNIIPKLTRDIDKIAAQGTQQDSSASKWYDIRAMQDDRNALLFAARYIPPGDDGSPARMFELDIIERDSQWRPVAHVVADRAEWDAQHQQWKLTRGRRVTGLLPNENRSPEQPVAVYQSNITPDEIALFRSGEFVNLLSRQRINQLLQRPQIYAAADLLRVKHFRISQLVMNVVMLLVAIPCVMMRDPTKLKLAILRCLVLVGLCMAGYFVAYQLAGRPPPDPRWADRWPAIMAFAPILVFGAVAAVLLDRLANKDS
ncbi:LptF/LptG family permease [Fontivita pretiosa]|uniref:LptF/LptG family permease n=1 Tax=Fontivita pretiosa TaxID=2989684 RepID=UPI003D1815A0